ncbi:MAG: PAS domain S-box protein [Herminiimonas sp.]|nr:PAS domain S-box protein [Herminiimonas sp.]
MAASIRNVLDGAQPTFSIDYPCHGPTEQNWFRLTVSSLGATQPTGAIVMHVNVTATKKIEATLSASELGFHQMAANISDAFFLADTHSKRMLYVSSAYEEIFGQSCAAMYADPNAWLALLSPDERMRLHAEYCAHQKTSNTRFDCVFHIVRPDLAVRWIALKVFSIQDENGRVTRITGAAEDITKSKNVARALYESEFRLRELLTNIGLISVMLNCDAKITFCNEALTQLTGWRHDEIIGRNWFELFMPGESASTLQHFATLLADQPEEGRHENQIRTRSGELRLICWTSSIMHAHTGEVVGIASLGEDITERQRESEKILSLNANLEKLSGKLIQAQEQERINLARELHDELGQRLALLKFDLYQLRRHLAEPDAIGIWINIDAAIVTLIGQIRVISVSLRPPALDYLGLESAIRRLLARQFANSAITTVFEYAGLPTTLEPSIEIAVYRIVQESLTNIIRHADAMRVVVEINGGESGRELEMIIRDNGRGFDRTVVSGHVLPNGGGSGLLGMKERIELMGGSFEVETAPGHGTRIVVSLPLKNDD